VLAIILQFLASTAGIALLVALARGLFAFFSDRGPRRRIAAIKAAHETADALGDHADAAILWSMRDRELTALAKTVARSDARRLWWSRTVFRLRNYRWASVFIGISVVVATLSIALADPAFRSDEGTGGDDLGLTNLISVAALAATATLALLTELFRRRTNATTEAIRIFAVRSEDRDDADPEGDEGPDQKD